MFRTAWTNELVEVSPSCCEGTHFQTRGNRDAPRDEEDEAALDYRRVAGPGFFDPAPAPFETGRQLLQVGEALCASTRVNVRGQPSTSSPIVRSLSAGERVTKSGSTPDGAWTQIGSGWVSSQFLGSCSTAPRVAPSVPSVSSQASSPSGVGASNGLCPKFYEVWKGYPNGKDVPSDQLVRRLFCVFALIFF